MERHPWRLIGIGFVLVLLGWILPFLMVIGILESSFFLGFLSYGASVSGLFLGVAGSAYLVHLSRRR